MNKQQAINLLKNLEQSLDDYCELNDEGKTAFRMAIEALNCSEIPNNSDTISRQAAIEAVKRHYRAHDNDLLELIAYELEKLSSAQPGQTDCDYCHEDRDGYVRPIEKNSHAWLVRRGRTMKLRVGFKGEYRECDILFCPMCGRRLTDG